MHVAGLLLYPSHHCWGHCPRGRKGEHPLSGGKWAVLLLSLQREGCWVCCRSPPLLLLLVLYLFLQDLALRRGVKSGNAAPRWAENQHGCGKRHVKPSGEGEPKPSRVWPEPRGAEPSWSCWAEGSRAEPGRALQSSTASSSGIEPSVWSRGASQHTL